MGKKYKNNIETTSGFSYTAKSPIDDRVVQTTIEDLSSLVSDNNVYDEMIVGVVNTGTYRYNQANNKWICLANTKIITRDSVNTKVLDEKLDNDSVDTINIKNIAVTKEKIADNAIGSNNITALSVTTEKIADKAVTEAKLSDDLNAIIIKGSYGTASMLEGDTLASGKIYIQYDI